MSSRKKYVHIVCYIVNWSSDLCCQTRCSFASALHSQSHEKSKRESRDRVSATIFSGVTVRSTNLQCRSDDNSQKIQDENSKNDTKAVDVTVTAYVIHYFQLKYCWWFVFSIDTMNALEHLKSATAYDSFVGKGAPTASLKKHFSPNADLLRCASNTDKCK